MLFFAAWGRNEFARGTTGTGSNLCNFVVHSLSWFHSKLLHGTGRMLNFSQTCDSEARVQPWKPHALAVATSAQP